MAVPLKAPQLPRRVVVQLVSIQEETSYNKLLRLRLLMPAVPPALSAFWMDELRLKHIFMHPAAPLIAPFPRVGTGRGAS
ncbi:hypothetical protein LTR66_013377 [Elasticomyces elasticus]|nr:hypothetical protein LTR66_013377 [Elasticomyces elasticus]